MRQVINSWPAADGLPVLDVTIVTDGGPWAQHNHPCPVCGDRHAIMDLGGGVFGPCGECTAEGWSLTYRRRRWWRR